MSNGAPPKAPPPPPPPVIGNFQSQFNFNYKDRIIDNHFNIDNIYLLNFITESKDNTAAPPPVPKASNDASRNALLGSISGFNKGKLKRTETVDKSAPKI